MAHSTATDRAAQAEDPFTILEAALNDLSKPVSVYREALEQATECLHSQFKRGAPVTGLVQKRAELIDLLLTRLWRHYARDTVGEAALVAVGGYGRGELHPYSDIDIMVLTASAIPKAAEAALSDFFTALWDIGLEIGHSVRTVSQCREESADDITIATTLIEARLIDGPAELFERMKEAISTTELWPSDRFFEAKRAEQRARHHRFDDTAYKLEPNVKGSPGGLRDIQMIGWVAKRHFDVHSVDELVAHHFLTPGQLRLLKEGQAFLWRVRYGLHVLTGRREDRLLFDHQSRLACSATTVRSWI
jgi:[protein-PII] uridylyltransferase